MARLRQIVLSFDQTTFRDAEEVKNEAANWILSRYPNLFSYKEKGRKGNIDIKQSLTVDMMAGKVVSMLPSDAFKSQETIAA
jgi:hypothetical protein